MINGHNEFQFLPKVLWSYFLSSTACNLSHRYKTQMDAISQVRTAIPNEERKWVSFELLSNSVFSVKKDLIGLDFNEKKPNLSSGEYLLSAIQDSIKNDLTL